MKNVFLSILSIVLIGSCATKKPTPPPISAAPKSTTIEDKTKSCKKMKGLFPLFQDTVTGNLYMLLTKEQLNKEYIYFSYTADGVVAAGHFRGAYRDNKLFTIRRYFDKIEFVVKNTGYYFDKNNPISKASNANISDAILVNQKIVAENAKNGEMLLDASAIFLSENMCQVKPSPFFGLPPGFQMFTLGSLSREKTKFVSLKNYSKNTDLVVEYVYDNPMPTVGGGKEVTDERAVSIFLQHTLIEAPQNNFKPTADDPRVGYFSEQIEDMTTTDAIAYKDLVHKWYLEKKDSSASISEPKEPIVWWIENTTPKEFRATIKEAGEKWNAAFEKAGFKNAVIIKEQPDTATWDAGDISYNVLRWTSSPSPPFGGYGPSFVDPRTGQILGADIMFEYIFVTNRLKQEELFDAKGLNAENYLSLKNQSFCDINHHLHQNTLFGLNVLELNNLNEIEKRDYIKQSLYYLVLHEMGHTLGLNHNMKASQMLKPSLVNNKDLTQKIGLTASVMDYPAVNVALDKAKQGDYFTTKPGPYDLWAIEFAYTTPLNDAEKEKERQDKILARSSDTLLIFGNDADDMRGNNSGIDPRVNVNDMSGDAITYGVDRIKLANQIFNKLKEKYTKNGQSYAELRQAYNITQSEYFNQTNVIVKYVGGIMFDRSFIGQTGATKPLIHVDYKEQKRAMDALSKYAFAPNAFTVQNNLYNYLQVQRRGFNFFGNTEDPKIHSRIYNYQSALIAHLLNATTLKRLTDSKLYGNKYSVLEMMTDLTQACFNEEISNPNTFRQNLQNGYTETLISVFKSSRYDAIAQAAALAQLKQILSIAKLGATNEAKAHYSNLKLKIDQALTAK